MKKHFTKYTILYTAFNALALLVLLGGYRRAFEQLGGSLADLCMVLILLFLLHIPFLLIRPKKAYPQQHPLEWGYVHISRVFLIGAWIFMIVANVHAQRLEKASRMFEQWAGFSPPQSVSHIRYHEYHGWVGKDAAVWIKFTCFDPQLVQILVANKRLLATDECASENPYTAPLWWDLSQRTWTNETRSSLVAYAGKRKVLCYDTQKHVVYYQAYAGS